MIWPLQQDMTTLLHALLQSPYLLPIYQRISFKVLLIVYKTWNNLAPSFLKDWFPSAHPLQPVLSVLPPVSRYHEAPALIPVAAKAIWFFSFFYLFPHLFARKNFLSIFVIKVLPLETSVLRDKESTLVSSIINATFIKLIITHAFMCALYHSMDIKNIKKQMHNKYNNHSNT